MVKAKKGSSKEEEEEVIKISTSDNDFERSVPEKQKKKSTEESISEEQVSSKREKKKKEKGKAKISEVSLFKDVETEKVFQSKQVHKPTLAGRMFLFQELKAMGQTTKENIDAVKWTDFLEIKEPNYSRLIRALYTAATSHKEDLYLESTIKGVTIVLTPDKIVEA